MQETRKLKKTTAQSASQRQHSQRPRARVRACTVAPLVNGLGGQMMPDVREFRIVCKYSPKSRQNSNTILYK